MVIPHSYLFIYERSIASVDDIPEYAVGLVQGHHILFLENGLEILIQIVCNRKAIYLLLQLHGRIIDLEFNIKERDEIPHSIHQAMGHHALHMFLRLREPVRHVQSPLPEGIGHHRHRPVLAEVHIFVKILAHESGIRILRLQSRFIKQCLNLRDRSHDLSTELFADTAAAAVEGIQGIIRIQ